VFVTFGFRRPVLLPTDAANIFADPTPYSASTRLQVIAAVCYRLLLGAFRPECHSIFPCRKAKAACAPHDVSWR